MEKRTYGNTELSLSVIGYGAGSLGLLSDTEASIFLEKAYELGINLFDTARSYENSESRIGNFIKDKRDKVFISTKVGYGIEGETDWTYNCVIKGIDRALSVLNTDYLDIVHLHSCGLDILKRGDVIDALMRAKKVGKVRTIAYSGENEALLYAIESDFFDGFQASLNIFDQNIIRDFLPLVIKKKFGFIAKRPLANTPWLYLERPNGNYCEEYWSRMKELNFRIDDLNYEELALRFSAFTYGVTSCIVGTTRVVNLEKNITNMFKGALTPDCYNYLNKTFFQTTKLVGANLNDKILCIN